MYVTSTSSSTRLHIQVRETETSVMYPPSGAGVTAAAELLPSSAPTGQSAQGAKLPVSAASPNAC